MAYDGKIIEIIIASPGDVAEERQIVRDVVAEWNAVYTRDRKVALMPVGWESHSSPELSGRPQQIINDRLLKHADILVGIFWTKVGSPTGKAISGTIEEIEEHRKAGKPVMLYFSNAPVVLDSVDPAQYEQLKIFKAWAKEQGLIESFDSRDNFREKFQRHLPIALNENPYLKSVLADNIHLVSTQPSEASNSVIDSETIGEDARELLSVAAQDKEGMILLLRNVGGTVIQAAGKNFAGADRRSIARWEAALEELLSLDLVRDISGKGQVFQITNAGYHFLDAIR